MRSVERLSVRLLIATDAWTPQTNGVVTTLKQTFLHMQNVGHCVEVLSPDRFATISFPGYREIRLALRVRSGVEETFRRFRPEAVHIATEGPVGYAVRRYCRRHGLQFTTSYHTQFPEYLRKRLPVPLAWSYTLLRRFHQAGRHCMVSTPSMQRLLEARGFGNIVRWRRGVDSKLFRPRDKTFLNLPRPIAVCVGRVAIEKNLEAFLDMPWEGSKLLVGDGPERARLQLQYPDAIFAGYLHGEALACHMAAADVMIFPSLTDTFGLVNLESMACGVPVAAFPVTGPVDIVRDGETGALDWNLAVAARRALQASAVACRSWAEKHDWYSCTREFEANLVPSGL
jgi:glycosyltransferase involved in cell wall biosynthesis